MNSPEADVKIRKIIGLYKAHFQRIDSEERYKWVAVKHFQDNWNIEAPDFPGMMARAFAKHGNLLDSGFVYPLGVLNNFASQEPEKVRALFRDLFDEGRPLDGRKDGFVAGVKAFVDKMREKDVKWKNHFQDLHAISVYLTSMYPENYYFYKYGVLSRVAPLLGLETGPDRLMKFSEMCDRIRDAAAADEELLTMNRARLGGDCYDDPNGRMLAQDIAYFAHLMQKEKEDNQERAYLSQVARDFTKWLEAPGRNRGKPYDYKTAKVYVKQIETEARKLIPVFSGNTDLFSYDTREAFTPRFEEISGILRDGDVKVNGAFPKVLGLYKQFLDEKENQGEIDPGKKTVKNAYNREKFLEEVFLTAEDYDSMINQLIRKKNLILQGPPGVGKTFAAKRLVYSLIGEETSERTGFIQFHQSYGYEDFVMGYRPDGDGFRMEEGVFCSFCRKAAEDPDNDWYFIIDEINRGNISRIFGDLLMLIEADKRGPKYAVTLQGTGDSFHIPENVYIIGMMNTADRSIALIDYALRRRFAFFTLEPAFENETFREYMENLRCEKLEPLIEVLASLNDEIADDPLLGPGYRIGHSYFCIDPSDGDAVLRDIVLYEIKPLLAEYWVDEPDKIREWTGRLLEIF